MKVLIPSPLRPYTGRAEVEATGTTLDAVLEDLNRRYPGLKFRMVDEQGHIRRHIRVFLDGQQTFDLGADLSATQSIQIVQALSGG
ncbi:MAG TPA: molybdopterin synthase sulfur carrier subunit [Alphaproteobacteria bacterium]|nr:molybdopterin synthase sulfur carrier subunit [Alphaproteobacteria bacterium]HAJ45247.1 molybdopterin synthase sulfur carrier subunit [Alphaproteobacteria bacterium]